MEIRESLNELFVQLFRDINAMEERAVKNGDCQNLTRNDMHVIEAIGDGEPKNMTSVAKALSVTTGTLTIAVNSLVKKEYVNRVRSEADRRVVLVSLTAAGRKAYRQHQHFRAQMIENITSCLNEEESRVLAGVLSSIKAFFREKK